MPWNEVYQALRRFWEQSGCKGEPPPMPLILNGWGFSNDVDKAAHWTLTLEWVEKFGCKNLIPEFGEDQKYSVEEMTSYTVGPYGGPMYLEWNYDPKHRPQPDEERKALDTLKANWGNIAAPEVAAATKPLQFTGQKRRRLLVGARKNTTPPWGGWDYLAPVRSEERSRSFDTPSTNQFIHSSLTTLTSSS
jgi:hypothetical protein